MGLSAAKIAPTRPSTVTAQPFAASPPTGNWSVRVSTDNLGSWAWSAGISGTVVLGFLVSSREYNHWFLLPIWACGTIVGVDVAAWFRGRLDMFDPAGLVALIGYHFFFTAPLIMVHWNYYTPLQRQSPDDWRPWLGGMAVINTLGLVLYRLGLWRGANARTTLRASAIRWEFVPSRLNLLIPAGLGLSLVLQTLVYVQYGGVAGYANTYLQSVQHANNSFAGMGILFLFSESFPILAVIGLASFLLHRNRSLSLWHVALLLLGVFVLRLYFGGLRGSRINFLWTLIWAAGIIHLHFRPFTKKLFVAGVAVFFLFSYLYGFYKSYGLEGLADAVNPAQRAQMEQNSGRTTQLVLIGDLSRVDIQALLLYRLSPGPEQADFDFAYGRTYLGAVSLMVPSFIWPDRPPGKIKWGTEAQFGPDSYNPSRLIAQQVYGLAGEGMLNFGPYAAPLPFLLLGYFVGRCQNWYRTWRPGDSRRFMLPFLGIFSMSLLIGDSDVNLVTLFKDGALPLLVILIGSRRLAEASSLPPTTAATTP